MIFEGGDKLVSNFLSLEFLGPNAAQGDIQPQSAILRCTDQLVRRSPNFSRQYIDLVKSE